MSHKPDPPEAQTPHPPETEPPIDQVGDTPLREAAYIVFSGFCMGSADVVPGVSGGTMAVALGIYERLIAAISSINKEALTALVKLQFKRVFEIVHWRFLCMLFAGIGLGIAIMVKLVKLPQLVMASSVQRPLVYAVFFGMVLASCFTLARHVKGWNVWRGAGAGVGAAVGWLIVTRVPVNTPDHPLFLFFCGAIAICAMLLPGISGSFILLILGKYAYILGALGKLQLGVILPFAAGCAVGILSFSRLLKWLLARFHDTVLAVLIGLLFGSLWRIWPYQHLTEIVVRHKPRVVGAVPFWPSSLDPVLLGGFVAGVVFVIVIEWYAVFRKGAAITAA